MYHSSLFVYCLLLAFIRRALFKLSKNQHASCTITKQVDNAHEQLNKKNQQEISIPLSTTTQS
jgi:hypothetical protein